MTSSGRTPLFGFAIVLVAASLFGTLGPLSNFAYDAGMEPVPFIAWRAALGALGTGAFVAWRLARGGARIISLRTLRTRERAALAIACACAAGLNLALFVAFDRVTIALALLCFYTYPAMVTGLDIATGREVLDRSKWIAMGLALGGMAAVVASQLDPAAGIKLDGLGVALALAAAVCQTVFVTVSRSGYRRIPADQAMTIILGLSLIVCTLLAIGTGGGAGLALPLAQPSLLPLLLFTGLFVAAIPSLFFLVGIRIIGGTRAGVMMLFEPVVGVALAAWLLGESLQPIQLVGGVAILAAALILQRTTPLGDQGVTPVVGPLDHPDPVEEETLALRVPGGP
ncbi:MAG: DMT family transporter [Actinobacteria bacterium]|nr:DMT family transporter [Actinomycetota bacterium]